MMLLFVFNVFYFIFWGIFDFHDFLFPECKRKKLQIPCIFDGFVDVRNNFRASTKSSGNFWNLISIYFFFSCLHIFWNWIFTSDCFNSLLKKKHFFFPWGNLEDMLRYFKLDFQGSKCFFFFLFRLGIWLCQKKNLFPQMFLLHAFHAIIKGVYCLSDYVFGKIASICYSDP